MKQYWNIKAIYPLGGHLIRDNKGELLRFESEQLALFECETMNGKRVDRHTNFIAVKEQ
jgi:hypothetical protein